VDSGWGGEAGFISSGKKGLGLYLAEDIVSNLVNSGLKVYLSVIILLHII
jgi:hypothetical protein